MRVFGGCVAVACFILHKAAIAEDGPLVNRQPKPTDATGFAPPHGTQMLPTPNVQDLEPNRIRILPGSGTMRRVGDRMEFADGAHFAYRGYEVRAAVAEGDLRTNIFILRGGVVVQGLDKQISGEQIAINFEERTYTFADGRATLSPEFLKGYSRSNLFLRAEEGQGEPQRLVSSNSALTTCNLPKPHFEIVARKSDVLANTRAVLRGVELFILGRKILHVPTLVVPLRDYPERYIPEFGQSDEEGYYVRSKFGVPLRGENLWDTRLDYFSKLGAGIGGDYYYNAREVRGLARIYQITGGPQSGLLSLDHRQAIFGGLLSVQADAQRNNYLTAPDTTTANIRGAYTIAQSAAGSSRITYLSRSSTRNVFSTQQQSIGFQDQRFLSSTLRMSLDATYVTSSNRGASTTTRREQVDLRFRGKQDLRSATAQLEYQRSIPVGQVQNFFNSSDRTPIFSLESDAKRLFGKKTADSFPFRTELSIGELVDSVQRRNITRTAFSFDMFKPDRRQSRWGFGYQNRFRQGLYSDDTAQYLLATDLGGRYSFSERSSFNLRYNYLRPYGFSPLSIDRTGRSNELFGDLSYQPSKSFSMSAQTSYDILELERDRSPWQAISVRTDWRPSSLFQFRTLANYDSANHSWRSVRFDTGWNVAGGFVSTGARFDGQRHTWASLNLFADGLRWGNLRTSALASYNGYSKQFEARHLSLTYDLHDAEAILQIIDNPVGFRSGTQIAFFFRLKALPFDTPFGVGRRGEAIGTSTGYGF